MTAQSPAAAAAVAAATAEREAVQQAAACALGLQQSMAWMRESPEEMEMVMWRQHMAHVRALCAHAAFSLCKLRLDFSTRSAPFARTQLFRYSVS